MNVVRVLVRTTGELLVTAGALILLFLVWQLFWTDVVANSAQERTTEALLEQWQQPDPSTDGTTDDAAEPSGAGGTAEEPAGEPPEALAELPAAALAVLRVPAFGDDYVKPVLQGTTPAVLRQGIGHYTGTAGPGEVGNFAIAGHRTTWGAPFNPIAELVPGDPVVVETADSFFVYRVVDSDIVRPSDVEVIAPVPDEPGAEPTEAYLTMTSCHPMFSARKRYIVHAVLESVSARADGTPEVLA